MGDEDKRFGQRLGDQHSVEGVLIESGRGRVRKQVMLESVLARFKGKMQTGFTLRGPAVSAMNFMLFFSLGVVLAGPESWSNIRRICPRPQ
ncbi:MAG: hypothetical protein LBO79_07930 [Zoogloeaceae bacterium]|jgi:hypothetical protein|nr:hypothetical protein [Zoogloeaceae bacterium]